MNNPFDPLGIWKAPFSGDVMQRIFSPALTVNYAGNAEVEQRVVADVASYGKQIGWLNQLVLNLIKGETPDKDTLRDFTAAFDKIEAIKKEHAKTTLEDANTALDLLQTEQVGEYRHLLEMRLQRLAPARP